MKQLLLGARHHRYYKHCGFLACTLLWLAILSTACGSEREETEDAGNDELRKPPPPGEHKVWTHEKVADGAVGSHIRLSIIDSGPAVAYLSTDPHEEDVCQGIGGDTPQLGNIWDLHLAQQAGAGWDTDMVAEVLFPSQPPGIDLASNEQGALHFTALTGEPIITATEEFCAANDVGYFTRDGSDWSFETAVAESGEASTGEPGSDFGMLVGYWPSLAFDSDGQPAIAYKDVHAGVIQSDDTRRADLELAWRSGGAWRHIPIDYGRGAGDYIRLAFDGEGRPVVVYYIPKNDTSQQGIWAARSEDQGATWQMVRLFSGSTLEGPDLTVDEDGTLYVVYYNSVDRMPELATLVDDEAFESAKDGWQFELFGNSRYDEGRYARIAADGYGHIGVAYYRCVLATESKQNCDPQDNALVFAYRDIDGDTWTVDSPVDEGDSVGECGISPALEFDADGTAVIAYQCQELVNDKLDNQVHIAFRESL